MFGTASTFTSNGLTIEHIKVEDPKDHGSVRPAGKPLPLPDAACLAQVLQLHLSNALLDLVNQLNTMKEECIPFFERCRSLLEMIRATERAHLKVGSSKFDDVLTKYLAALQQLKSGPMPDYNEVAKCPSNGSKDAGSGDYQPFIVLFDSIRQKIYSQPKGIDILELFQGMIQAMEGFLDTEVSLVPQCELLKALFLNVNRVLDQSRKRGSEDGKKSSSPSRPGAEVKQGDAGTDPQQLQDSSSRPDEMNQTTSRLKRILNAAATADSAGLQQLALSVVNLGDASEVNDPEDVFPKKLLAIMENIENIRGRLDKKDSEILRLVFELLPSTASAGSMLLFVRFHRIMKFLRLLKSISGWEQDISDKTPRRLPTAEGDFLLESADGKLSIKSTGDNSHQSPSESKSDPNPNDDLPMFKAPGFKFPVSFSDPPGVDTSQMEKLKSLIGGLRVEEQPALEFLSDGLELAFPNQNDQASVKRPLGAEKNEVLADNYVTEMYALALGLQHASSFWHHIRYEKKKEAINSKQRGKNKSLPTGFSYNPFFIRRTDNKFTVWTFENELNQVFICREVNPYNIPKEASMMLMCVARRTAQ